MIGWVSDLWTGRNRVVLRGPVDRGSLIRGLRGRRARVRFFAIRSEKLIESLSLEARSGRFPGRGGSRPAEGASPCAFDPHEYEVDPRHAPHDGAVCLCSQCERITVH